jgi:hypothetical protein
VCLESLGTPRGSVDEIIGLTNYGNRLICGVLSRNPYPRQNPFSDAVGLLSALFNTELSLRMISI